MEAVVELPARLTLHRGSEALLEDRLSALHRGREGHDKQVMLPLVADEPSLELDARHTGVEADDLLTAAILHLPTDDEALACWSAVDGHLGCVLAAHAPRPGRIALPPRFAPIGLLLEGDQLVAEALLRVQHLALRDLVIDAG